MLTDPSELRVSEPSTSTMSEKVERRTENGGGAGGGGAVAGDAAGGGGGGGAGDNNCHEVGAFSVPLISKVRKFE